MFWSGQQVWDGWIRQSLAQYAAPCIVAQQYVVLADGGVDRSVLTICGTNHRNNTPANPFLLRIHLLFALQFHQTTCVRQVDLVFRQFQRTRQQFAELLQCSFLLVVACGLAPALPLGRSEPHQCFAKLVKHAQRDTEKLTCLHGPGENQSIHNQCDACGEIQRHRHAAHPTVLPCTQLAYVQHWGTGINAQRSTFHASASARQAVFLLEAQQALLLGKHLLNLQRL